MAKRPRVAVLVEASRSYGRALLQGIAEYVRVCGPWSISLDDRGLREPPVWLKNWRGNGMIARVETRPLGRALLSRHVPIVDVRGAVHDLGIPLVETDEDAVVRLAVEHFRQRGFRHFAYCGFPGANYSDRREGTFREQLAAAGFGCDVYQPPGPSRGALWELERQNLAYRDHLARWLKKLPKPTGLMACNDIRGQQTLDACREAGIAVPDEIAVLGVDNDELLCNLADPPLSSVAPNARRIGYEAAALLDGLMAGQPSPPATIFIPPLGLTTRRSTDVLAVEDRDVAGAVRFIRENACKGIQVHDVLAAVPLSRSVLERRFVQFLGRTPKAEIDRVRMERVKQLLAETDFSLPRVAAMTGFVHSEYLSVAFKNHTGQTPGRYRTLTRQGKGPMGGKRPI